jgi:hypothetical protein
VRAGSFGQRGSALYPFVGYTQACTSMESRHAVELGKRRAGRRAPVFNHLGVRIRGIGGGPLAPASPGDDAANREAVIRALEAFGAPGSVVRNLVKWTKSGTSRLSCAHRLSLGYGPGG